MSGDAFPVADRRGRVLIPMSWVMLAADVLARTDDSVAARELARLGVEGERGELRLDCGAAKEPDGFASVATAAFAAYDGRVPRGLGILLEGFDEVRHPRDFRGRWRKGDKVHVVTPQGHVERGMVEAPAQTYDAITSRGTERSTTVQVRWENGDVSHERPEDLEAGHRRDRATTLGREGAAARARGASALTTEHADTRDKLTNLPVGQSYGLHGPQGQVGRVERTGKGWEVYGPRDAQPSVHRTPSSAAGHAMRIQRSAAQSTQAADRARRNYAGQQELAGMNARQAQRAEAEAERQRQITSARRLEARDALGIPTLPASHDQVVSGLARQGYRPGARVMANGSFPAEVVSVSDRGIQVKFEDGSGSVFIARGTPGFERTKVLGAKAPLKPFSQEVRTSLPQGENPATVAQQRKLGKVLRDIAAHAWQDNGIAHDVVGHHLARANVRSVPNLSSRELTLLIKDLDGLARHGVGALESAPQSVLGVLLEGFAPTAAGPPASWAGRFDVRDQVSVPVKGGEVIGRVLRASGARPDTHVIIDPGGSAPHIEAPVAQVRLHTPESYAAHAQRQAAAAAAQPAGGAGGPGPVREAFAPSETPAQSQQRGARQVAAAQKQVASGWNAQKHPRAHGGRFGYTTGGKRATRSPAASSRTVGVGARGALVSAIQRQLHAAQDGVYGPQTRAAVTRFQKQHHLQVDGVVGRQTLAALRGNPRARSIAPGPIGSRAATVRMHPSRRVKRKPANRYGGGVLV